MEYITSLGVFGFVLRFAYVLTGLLFLWWRKEYRLDRMVIHLKTKQGENVLFGKTHIALFIAVFFWVVIPDLVTTLLSLGVGVLGFTYLLRIRRWLLPPISPKVLVLAAAFIIYIGLIVLVLPVPVSVALSIADLLLFPFSVLVVLGMTLPTRLYHAAIIRKAVRNLAGHSPMTVIGITGSYGKTSVKEYLSTMLLRKLPTLKTEASRNSPIGISEVILRALKPQHRAFVVEMGAYKRGEIREMTEMVKPEIGILTAINPQHQDLFGSIETTMKAKYELLQGLTGRKIAIVNLDDAKTREMGGWAAKDGCTVWGWTVKDIPSHEHVVSKDHIFKAVHVLADMNGVAFDCVAGQEQAPVSASVLGAHQAGNLLAAIAGAVASGMSLAEACAAASGVTAAHKVMEIVPGRNGIICIDDTFNNNPDAAKAAISFLGLQKGKKIVVFQPMIELGSFAESAHEEVGKLAAESCDAIFLTNGNFFAAFERGVRSISIDLPVLVLSPFRIANYIRSHTQKGDIVLFKGKDTEHALNMLTA